MLEVVEDPEGLPSCCKAVGTEMQAHRSRPDPAEGQLSLSAEFINYRLSSANQLGRPGAGHTAYFLFSDGGT